MTHAIIRRIEDICGAENVIFGDVKKLERYGKDQAADKTYPHLPEAVAKPGTSEEVAALVRLAASERFPVTPRGAGSGLSGGAVPALGGLVISLERMNRILEIDRDNMTAVLEPGVVTRELDHPLSEAGLIFAGYPMSEEFCFIGGNVGENAGGGRAVKYGVTGQYVTGLEVVLPNGEIVRLGGKRVKDVTGYDLVHLMVGSEGTLGIFTKIWLKLTPRPTARRSLLAFFPDTRSAVRVLPRIMTKGGLIPTSAEYADRLSLHWTCEQMKETLPWREAGAMLLLETDGHSEKTVEEQAGVLEKVCREAGVQELFTAQTEQEGERFWKIRKMIPWALKRRSPMQSMEDIVVPPAAIPDFLDALEEISARRGTQIPCFGHAGDGNLHATPVKNADETDEQWAGALPGILEDMYRAAARLGGTISGEHGIGHKRRGWMHLVMGPAELDLLRRIKSAIDPEGIMNPGKII